MTEVVETMYFRTLNNIPKYSVWSPNSEQWMDACCCWN